MDLEETIETKSEETEKEHFIAHVPVPSQQEVEKACSYLSNRGYFFLIMRGYAYSMLLGSHSMYEYRYPAHLLLGYVIKGSGRRGLGSSYTIFCTDIYEFFPQGLEAFTLAVRSIHVFN